MLRKKLSGILAVIMVISTLSVTGFAQTEETKLFSDNFENGLNSEMWNIASQSGLGQVKSDQVKWMETSETDNTEFSYTYSAEKEDVSFNAVINASAWKSDGEAFGVCVRYVDEDNYFKLTYTPSTGKFALSKCVDRTLTEIASASKSLAADTNYNISVQAKHGVVRLELDGITLIQDYTGIDNFDKEATSNYAKFITYGQKLKITSLSINEEDTLLHQNFSNTGIIMTQSKTPQTDVLKLGSGYTQESDSISVSGTTGLEFALANEDWVQSNLGTDFSATEATYVLKHEGNVDGVATLHFRTNMSTDGKTTYLAKVTRDGWSLGDNYGANNQSEKVKNDGYGNELGFRPLNLGEYHTYKVRKVPASDYSYVTVTLYVDGAQKLEWKDESPAFTANDDGIIIAGGLGFAISGEIKTNQKYSLKSYELRDITGNDNEIYKESFENLTNWTNAEIKTSGGSDNKYYITTKDDNGTLIVSNKSWKNIVTEADVLFDEIPSSATTDNYAGIIARYKDENNYVMGAYSPYGSAAGKGTVFVKSVVNGTATTVASHEITAFESGVTHRLGIGVKDGVAIVYIDGESVLNAPFSTQSAETYGSVALKSNNLATKFDNISVSGTPYYFVEEFKSTPNLSAYKSGAKQSEINSKVTLNEDGTVTIGNDGEIYLYVDESYAGDWDDVEMTVRMKTNNRTDMSCLYFRGGVDDTAACYYIENSTKSNLGFNEKWGTIVASTEGIVNVPNSAYYDVKLRLTDEKTEAGDTAVRIRYTVNGTEMINYLDDGTKAKETANSVTDTAIQNLLNSHPLKANTHGRGFRISCSGNESISYIIDSIKIADPDAGKIIANVSVPQTFDANTDVTSKLTVDNKDYESKEVMFITAFYDGDELKNVKVSYPSTASDESMTFTTKGNSGTATKIKVFVWDVNTMCPLSQHAISTIASTPQQSE